MTFATAIQTFTGPHTGLGNTSNGQCTPDWARGFVYIHSTNTNPGTNGGNVSKSQLVGGGEVGYVAVADINDSLHHVSVQPPSALADDGNLFLSTASGMCKLDTTDWTRNDTWGAYTSAAHPFGPPGAPDGIGSNDAVISGKMCAITTANNNFTYATGLGSVSPPAHWTNLCNLPLWKFSFTWAGRTHHICSGAANSGDFWLLCGNVDPALGFFPLNIYHMNVTDGGVVTNNNIATYNPTDIDAGWTNIQCSGVCYDQTDGHLLAHVDGTNANKYLMKFNSTTGAIIWQTLLPQYIGPGEQMSYSNVFGGVYCAFGNSPKAIYTFDTTDGSYTTQTTGVGGLLSWQPQSYNAEDGAILLNMAWGAAADGPTPLGGSTPSFSGWAYLYVAPGITPPPAPGTPGGPATSRKRAWTYTLDGHAFYVLDLGAEGTWQYDKSTQTWSNYYTSSYVQWNVANGCMWGNRIVGGDLASTDVWEVTASNLTDQDDTFQIPHIVTGGLLTRSRSQFGCDALLLSASLGDLGDTTGSAINMRFSDDGGRTWSDYFTLPMAQDDFTTELRWMSLGSFGAPGRVFEFSDVGGPRSLEGCDAFLDNFDSEKAPGE